MFWLTEDAVLVCKHQLGKVENQPSQEWVRIEQRCVLVESDPQGRPISGCPNYGPTIKPCTTTLKVEAGYSPWIRVGARAVCLDTVTGYTDGTPPGIVKYLVNVPGQAWIQQR